MSKKAPEEVLTADKITYFFNSTGQSHKIFQYSMPQIIKYSDHAMRSLHNNMKNE